MINSSMRENFYKDYPEFHHTFDDGISYLEYALYGNLSLPRSIHLEIVDASEKMMKILNKIKEKINIPGDLSREEMEKIAMEDEKVKGLTEGKNVVKVIAVPNKLLNIVVK